ncbi:MAG: hypothetical protein HC779_04265, partial [Phyllobacteriaceae bacterium]|nr:hypothetical protein [Phyllobacteriaceae bacterium]
MKKARLAVSPEFTREAVLDFLARNPTRSSKRDIAKAFNLRGDDRIALKLLLHELEQDGALQRQGDRLVRHDALPPVAC